MATAYAVATGEDRRRVGDLRPRPDADHDGADDGRAGAHPAGRLLRREPRCTPAWYNQHIDQAAARRRRLVRTTSPAHSLERMMTRCATPSSSPAPSAGRSSRRAARPAAGDAAGCPSLPPSTRLHPRDWRPMVRIPTSSPRRPSASPGPSGSSSSRGRGAVRSDARRGLRAAGGLPTARCSRPRCPVRGLFDHGPCVASASRAASPMNAAREASPPADLVIAVGASLTHHIGRTAASCSARPT